MYNYLEKYNLIDERQFGFRSNHSTIHAISSIYDELLKSKDDKLYNCCLFLDFSKALDTVNHKILLKKLENNFGFRDNAKLFLSNYLSNRNQYTRVSNYRSSLRTVTCGVPQGSALGPLLFLLYVNDLPSSSNFKATLFADDTLLQLSDCNIKKLEKRVNNELNKINVWLRNNKISLNISKTNYVLIDNCINALTKKHFEIKLQQNVLNRVENVKYLGMLIDDGLNWDPHIKQLSLQLSKSSAIIYRLRNFVDTETLKLLYYSRVQYGIILWGTATYSRQKEIVLRLNNIVRIMTWSRKFDHVSILYNQLKLLKLEDIYKLELSKFKHQLNCNMTPKVFEKNFVKLESVHSYSRRQKTKNNYFLTRVNKTMSQKQLAFCGTKLWAPLDNFIKTKPLPVFKKILKERMIRDY